MIRYVTIIEWFQIERIQANRPNRWQKILVAMGLGRLPVPKYWFTDEIIVKYPHPMRTGDVILTRELKQYIVMSRMLSSALYTERFRISSVEPMERSISERGKVVIMGQAYSEINPNTQPFGGQVL